MDIVGNIAYITDISSGLQIIDVTNPSNPIFKGSYNTPGTAGNIDIIENLAYIRDDGSGLQIIDVSNPSAPILKGSYNIPSIADMEIVGNLAYLLNVNLGLQIIDLTDSSNPILKGSYDTPGQASDIEIIGKLAYIADGNAGLQIIDITDSSDPILKDNFSEFSCSRVTVEGNLAYINGSKVVDISNSFAPTYIGSYHNSGSQYIEIIDNLAYIAGNSGLHIFESFDAFVAAADLTLAINDVTITEGNGGNKNAVFTVTLTGTATQPTTVNFDTANGTATAGSDYTATSGILTFAVGETTKTITVPILGDTTVEPDETFFVNLTNPSNATISDAQGFVTITNDDANNITDYAIYEFLAKETAYKTWSIGNLIDNTNLIKSCYT
jgi:hypothetical protein